MGLKPDHWIRKMAHEHRMIEPFVEGQVRNGVISYGVSSYGYDIRVADEFKIFTNVFSAVVDPKNFDPKSMVDYTGDVCVIPPNSFALARTIEYFRIPRQVLTVCLGKSTYARCFHGDTRVALVDGTAPTLEEMARRSEDGELFWGYSVGPEGNIIVTLLEQPRYIGRDSLIEIVLDTRQSIFCTPDHKFMTRDGNMLEADRLRPGSSLMPLYRQISRAGEMVYQPEGSFQSAQDLWQKWKVRNGSNVEPQQRKFSGVALPAATLHNHTISTIRDVPGDHDVYCLTVPEAGNFALDAGVFVSNCGIIVNVTPFEPCYSEDTEILTDQGWKLIREVKVGERVLGMCPDGHADWQPVWKKQVYPYYGNLLHFEGRNIDLLVTPEHKLLVRKRVIQRWNTKGIYTDWHTIEASEVHGKYNYEMSRRVIWNGLDIGDQVSIGKENYPTDAFLEFLGMYLGDGSCYINKGGYLIKIAAFKPRELEVCESILQRLGVKYNRTKTGYQFFSKEFYNFLHPLGHAHEKYIPHWVKELSPNYLERLLFGLMNSDGNLETSTYTTTSWRLADDVQEVMFKAGCAAIVREAKRGQDREINAHTVHSNHPVYKVRMCKKQLDPKTYPKTHKQVAYQGNVYDVTVPGHIVFVRRNGKAVWSGNCWEGYVTLEISNTTPLPAKIYANEGIAQVLFFEADEECEISYADKKGKYQKQQSIVLPKL